MFRNVVMFLVGILVLLVILWGFHEIIPFLGLPAEIAHVATVIVGLLGLLCLCYLAYRAFFGGGPPNGGPPGW